MDLEVGVGYHHPPIQWLKRPMDARQRGNPAAVASRAVAWNLDLASRLHRRQEPYLLGRRAAAGSSAREFVLCRTGGTAYVTRPRSH